MEYIERDAALESLCTGCEYVPIEEKEVCPYRFTGCQEYANIFALPAADVVPVRHGRWIKDCDRVMGDGWTYTQRHCSECGGQSVECVNYCQFCGARMDGDGA